MTKTALVVDYLGTSRVVISVIAFAYLRPIQRVHWFSSYLAIAYFSIIGIQ